MADIRTPLDRVPLYEFLQGSDRERLARRERKPGNHSTTTTYRWIARVPLRDGEDALKVNWIGVAIANASGQNHMQRHLRDQPAGDAKDRAAEIAACARWKIENESFNVLKNNGYHLKHNFGHGKRPLAKTFAAMNLLAFAFHAVCDCLQTQWSQVRGNR